MSDIAARITDRWLARVACLQHPWLDGLPAHLQLCAAERQLVESVEDQVLGSVDLCRVSISYSFSTLHLVWQAKQL